MTVLCEPKTGGPFDLHTNPPSDARHHICAKCGTTWTDGTPAPACSTGGASKALSGDTQEYLKTRIGDSVDPAAIQAIPQNMVLVDVAPNEPFFILRASDLLADYLVEQWAKNAESHGCDPRKVKAARDKANEFRAWPGRRYPT